MPTIAAVERGGLAPPMGGGGLAAVVFVFGGAGTVAIGRTGAAALVTAPVALPPAGALGGGGAGQGATAGATNRFNSRDKRVGHRCRTTQRSR
jgi:hypothetical protein